MRVVRVHKRVVAFLLVLGAAGSLSLWIGLMKAPLPGDVIIGQEMNGWSALHLPVAAINLIGSWNGATLGVMVALGVLVWGLHGGQGRSRAVLTLILIIPLLFLDDALKAVADSPRPGAEFGIIADGVYVSGGFPSGHTMLEKL